MNQRDRGAADGPGRMQGDSEVLEQFAEQVRRFVRAELIPAEAQVEEEDRVPDRLIATMRSLGLFGMSIPESYGGLGFSMYEEVRIVFELCYASPVFRSCVGSNNGIGSLGILIDGTEEQKWR